MHQVLVQHANDHKSFPTYSAKVKHDFGAGGGVLSVSISLFVAI